MSEQNYTLTPELAEQALKSRLEGLLIRARSETGDQQQRTLRQIADAIAGQQFDDVARRRMQQELAVEAMQAGAARPLVNPPGWVGVPSLFPHF